MAWGQNRKKKNGLLGQTIEKASISKHFLVLGITPRFRFWATPKRKVVSSSLAGGAKGSPHRKVGADFPAAGIAFQDEPKK